MKEFKNKYEKPSILDVVSDELIKVNPDNITPGTGGDEEEAGGSTDIGGF